MSADRLSLEELAEQIAPLEGYVGRKIRHVASSDYYEVTGIHYREADMTIGFTYRSSHKRTVTFSRPVGELLDGRFQVI